MVTDFELGWLAGIFEGEGSARIYKRNTRSVGYWVQIQAATSTDFTIIERACSILTRLGITFSLRKSNGNSKRKTHWAPCADIRILRVEDCRKFLEVLLPMLGGFKKQQADLILSFFALDNRTRRKGRGHKTPKEFLDVEAALYAGQNFRPKAVVATAVN